MVDAIILYFSIHLLNICICCSMPILYNVMVIIYIVMIIFVYTTYLSFKYEIDSQERQKLPQNGDHLLSLRSLRPILCIYRCSRFEWRGDQVMAQGFGNLSITQPRNGTKTRFV